LNCGRDGATILDRVDDTASTVGVHPHGDVHQETS